MDGPIKDGLSAWSGGWGDQKRFSSGRDGGQRRLRALTISAKKRGAELGLRGVFACGAKNEGLRSFKSSPQEGDKHTGELDSLGSSSRQRGHLAWHSQARACECPCIRAGARNATFVHPNRLCRCALFCKHRQARSAARHDLRSCWNFANRPRSGARPLGFVLETRVVPVFTNRPKISPQGKFSLGRLSTKMCSLGCAKVSA